MLNKPKSTPLLKTFMTLNLYICFNYSAKHRGKCEAFVYNGYKGPGLEKHWKRRKKLAKSYFLEGIGRKHNKRNNNYTSLAMGIENCRRISWWRLEAAHNASLTKMRILNEIMSKHTIGQPVNIPPNFVRKGINHPAQRQICALPSTTTPTTYPASTLMPPAQTGELVIATHTIQSAELMARHFAQARGIQVTPELVQQMHKLSLIATHKVLGNYAGTDVSPVQSSVAKEVDTMVLEEDSEKSDSPPDAKKKGKAKEGDAPAAKKPMKNKPGALKISG